MTLADAVALVPKLITAPADPQGDMAALERLADWCCRYSPWVAVDGADSIIMDITGVPHLFGGDDAMLLKMYASFRGIPVGARLAIAESPAAAWAWSHFGKGGVLPSRPASFDHLSTLPISALRLDAETVSGLRLVGFKTIVDIANLPRAPLARRFGKHLLNRLDCLLARQDEPISPRQQRSPWRSYTHLPEPVSTRDVIDTLVDRLLEGLCQILEKEHLGARQLALHAYRVDGDIQTLRIGTSYPSRNPKHLARLFRDTLDGIMPGFGFETFVLEATAADPFSAEQANLETTHQVGSGYAQLIDRLQSRLGHRNVFRYEPLPRHTPEASVARLSPMARSNAQMPKLEPRPIRLLQAEPIEMEATGETFTWRGIRRRIVSAIGPERIHSEWQLGGLDIVARDYFKIQVATGHRYWIFRENGKWHLQGIFP